MSFRAPLGWAGGVFRQLSRFLPPLTPCSDRLPGLENSAPARPHPAFETGGTFLMVMTAARRRGFSARRREAVEADQAGLQERRLRT